MTHAQDLLHCQRCTVYIIDKAQTEESEDVSILVMYHIFFF